MAEEYYYKDRFTVTLEGEQWIDCLNYEGLYEVSNLGRVRSIVKNKKGDYTKATLMSQNISSNRLQIRLTRKKNSRAKSVSKLMWFSYHPEDYSRNTRLITIGHKDGDGLNNCIDNLVFSRVEPRKPVDPDGFVKRTYVELEDLTNGEKVVYKNESHPALLINRAKIRRYANTEMICYWMGKGEQHPPYRVKTWQKRERKNP